MGSSSLPESVPNFSVVANEHVEVAIRKLENVLRLSTLRLTHTRNSSMGMLSTCRNDSEQSLGVDSVHLCNLRLLHGWAVLNNTKRIDP